MTYEKGSALLIMLHAHRQATRAQIAFITAYPSYAEKVSLCSIRWASPWFAEELTLRFMQLGLDRNSESQ